MAGAKTKAKRSKQVKSPANGTAASSDEEQPLEKRRLYEKISAELTVLEEQADRLLKSRLH
jgi:hypothetical protein